MRRNLKYGDIITLHGECSCIEKKISGVLSSPGFPIYLIIKKKI